MSTEQDSITRVGIVPIRRYILLRSVRFFFYLPRPKTAGRRTASEKDQASITRGPAAGRTKETAEGQRRGGRRGGRAKARY